ncbi:early nodulin-55-2-like [Oryza brachyantha]|uniref:early nodulin-55-2-like n=1 Tax=Oryza brachyantha TaxID=4533 RepID=UPI001ADC86D2|nr:early nodulin-55-2-like [Oryza brachyantha]
MARSTAAIAAVVAVVAAMAPSPAAGQGAPAAGSPAPPYKNHTVAGADGWFFSAKSNTTSGNYSDWAAGEAFYLGDYLIFKTDENSSVVQTSNETAYSLCDAEGSDILIYSFSGAERTHTIAVPLTVEGANYFFSDADEGAQCEQGMRFEIKVAHGRGLPPDLANPPPAPKPRVLAPPPAGTSMNPAVAGAGNGIAGDMTEGGKNGGSRAVGAGGRFLGVAIGMGLAVLAAA